MATKPNVPGVLKPLINALTDADYRYQFRPHQLFEWLIEEVLVQFKVRPSASYPPEAKQAVQRALVEYCALVQKKSMPFDDLLGPVYMALASVWGQKSLGQYFTPQPLARLLAALSMGDEQASARTDGAAACEPDRAGLVRICDPTCGSGVLLLSALQHVMDRHGRLALRRFSVTGVDLDRTCAQMFAAQVLMNLSAHDIVLGEVVVLRGNSLLPWDRLETVVHASAKSCSAAEQGSATTARANDVLALTTETTSLL